MKYLLAVAATLLFASSLANGKETKVEGQVFPASVTAAGTTLQLSGVGTARFKVLFKIYAGAVYLPAGKTFDNVFDPIPRRLEIAYLYDIEKEDLVAAADNFLKKNVGEKRFAEMAGDVAKINALFRAVKKGERCALTYLPGKGLEVAYNGKAVGVVPGEAFARDYYKIWLGRDSCSPGFRKSVMRGLK